jgi:hypothetical protein
MHRFSIFSGSVFIGLGLIALIADFELPGPTAPRYIVGAIAMIVFGVAVLYAARINRRNSN